MEQVEIRVHLLPARGSSSSGPLETGNRAWKEDRFYDSRSSEGTAVDEPSFLEKQKRRLSENPVMSKIQSAKKESGSKIGFIRRVCVILTSSTCFTILLLMLLSIPLSKTVMGAFFFDKCPAEPMIPIYLLIGGSVACFRDLVNITLRYFLSDETYYRHEVTLTAIAFVYELAELAWFICGSVYVYKTYQHYQYIDRSRSDYCNMLLYAFAFVVTTLTYFLVALALTVSCLTMFLADYLDDQEVEYESRMAKKKKKTKDKQVTTTVVVIDTRNQSVPKL